MEYKKTDLGIIPDKWIIKSIQQLIDDSFITGHLDGNHGELYPRSHEFISDGVAYIGANDFVDGNVSFENCKFLNLKRASQFRKGIAKDGDVLFAHNATVGPVALLRTKEPFVILSTTATYYRCNLNKLNNLYLKAVLQAQFFVKQYQAVMAQSTRFQVPITTQRKLSLVIPPFVEQRAIATALSDIDTLLAGLSKLIAKKRDIKQATMQQLLTGKTRLPGFSGKWRELLLGDVLTICHGKNQREVEVVDGVYPILATGGQIGTALRPLYNKPSVLIGRKGTINQPQYMDTPFWTVDTLFYSILKAENNAKFFYYRFLLIDWMQFNEASGVPSLNARTIERIEINCPPPDEQTAIAQILSDMDNEISALEKRLEKTRMLKQGMMQELLTGRIRLV